MFIGHFTERPYQDPNSGYFGATGRNLMDLAMSNDSYDPRLGADLYNRYLDEKRLRRGDGLRWPDAERAPFHALLHGRRDEPRSRHPCPHHPSAPRSSCLGNILPIWDDPLVARRGTGRDRHDLARSSRHRLGARHRARKRCPQRGSAPYNWERFQEAHDFIVDAWMRKPGPFRWEGEHYHYRYVNPWARPVSGAAPADLDSGRDEPQHRRLGRHVIATPT